MAVMRCVIFVLFLALASTALAFEGLDYPGLRIALKVYDDCNKADGFTPCLKKKAVTFLDRLARMDKVSIADGVDFVKATDAPLTQEPTLSEEQLETTLPRSADAKDEALNNMLMEKISTVIGSRTLQISVPKMVEEFGLEEGRGKKNKGMMNGMMMGIAAKIAALIPIAIAGLFLLAGKALITAKIALLISGIIALKKLFASKHGGGGGGHGGWQSGGGGGGWQSSGGGWDKRSLDAQKLAYKSYNH